MAGVFGQGETPYREHQAASAENITGAAENLGLVGRFGKKIGRKASQQGFKALQETLPYFRTLLSGDRQAMGELLAPEIGAITGQADAARRNIAEFGPRGGGTTSAINNLETGKAQAIGELYQKARPYAAQGLSQIGSTLMGAGTANLGVASGAYEGQAGAYGTQANAYNNIARLVEAERQRRSAAWGSLFEGIGNIAGGFLGGL